MALPPVPVYTQPFDAFTPLASIGQSFGQGMQGGQQTRMNRQQMGLNDLVMQQRQNEMAAPGEIAGAYLQTLGGLAGGGQRGPMDIRSRAQMGGGQPVRPSGTAPMQRGGMRMPPGTTGTSGDLKGQFMSTVKGAGLTNPFGLAAVAATGQRESGFDPRNATRTWSDPSESGQPGTSGGIMSWRGPRLQAMQQFAQQRGDRPDAPSVETQAMFFAQEDPQLIPRLNAAQSPEEAAQIMAQAWRFAGFDRPGGEAAERQNLTRQFAGMFGGQADAPASGARPAQSQGQQQPPNRIIRMMQSSNPSVQQRGIEEFQAWEQAQAQAMQPDFKVVGSDLVRIQGNNVEQAYSPQPGPGFRMASPQEAERYGAQAGQFGPDGRFYATGQNDGAMSQRVQMLMETGLPQNVAQGIAAGRLKADRDPVSGALQVIDMGTGQIVYGGPGGEGGQGAPEGGPGGQRRQSTLPGDTDFLSATGVGGFTASLANTVADVFGGDLPNEESERANQALNNLRVRTQVALASDVTGRPSNYLLQQFDQLAVRPAEISMGPARARERFQQTQAMLANEIQLTRQIVENPRQFQPSKVSNARIRLNELETLFNDYSRVIESFEQRQPGRGAPQPGTVEQGYRFLGGDPGDPNSWERAE